MSGFYRSSWEEGGGPTSPGGVAYHLLYIALHCIARTNIWLRVGRVGGEVSEPSLSLRNLIVYLKASSPSVTFTFTPELSDAHASSVPKH